MSRVGVEEKTLIIKAVVPLEVRVVFKIRLMLMYKEIPIYIYAHIFLFGLILRDIPNSITPQTPPGRTACTLSYPPVHAVPPYSPPPFFPLSRTEEPANAGTRARDRRALQQLALNVHVEPNFQKYKDTNGMNHVTFAMFCTYQYYSLSFLYLINLPYGKTILSFRQVVCCQTC